MPNFKQGDLDGLCGVYALANGWSNRIYQSKIAADLEGEEAFKLALKAVPRSCFPQIIWEGMDHKLLLDVCVRFTRLMHDMYLRSKINIRLKVEAPFVKRRFLSCDDFLTEIGEYHSKQACCIILAFDRDDMLGHWAAFKGFTRSGGIRLTNSSPAVLKETQIECRKDAPRRPGRQKFRIDPKETIICSLMSFDGLPP